MKKVYEKPQIMFESFILSTNIAGDCEVKTNNPNNSSCALDFSGVPLFLDTISDCQRDGGIVVKSQGGDGEYNGICYHVPYGNNLFNS